MKCSYCGSEIAGNAKFCTACGKCLEDINVCPKCNTQNDKSSKFCKACGTSLSGKMICKKCKNEISDNNMYCPNCGASCNDGLVNINPKIAKTKFLVVEKTLTPALMIVGLFVLLICSFFMGINLKSVGLESSISSLLDIAEEGTVLSFFSDVFKAMNSSRISGIDELFFYLWLPTVILALVLGVNIIVGITCLTISMVKFGVGISKQKEINISSCFIWAFACFVLSLGVLCSSGANSKVYQLSDFVKVKTALNAPALLGLITSILVILSGFVLRLIAEYITHRDTRKLLSKILAGILVFSALITLFSFAKNCINFTAESKNGNTLVDLEIKCGALCLSQLVGCRWLATGVSLDKIDRTLRWELILEIESTILTVVFMIVAILLVVVMAFGISSMFNSKQHPIIAFILSVTVLVVTISIFIFMAIMLEELEKFVNINGESTWRSSIGGIIFAFLSTVLSVFWLCVKPKKQKEE